MLEKSWQLLRSTWASEPMSGMHSLIVVMSWHDAFHIGTIDTFIADVQLWQRCYGQPLWSQ